MAKPRAKAEKATAPISADFEPDAFCIRTTDRDGHAYGGFQWDRTIGAVVSAPDWDPVSRCGGGLHGNLDGVQDWSLQSDAHDALWWIVGVRRDECVAIDADKVKFPRCEIIYVGVMAEAMRLIAQQWRRVALEAREGAKTSGAEAHASTTGGRAHASTTGAEAHASTTGGKNTVAVALGRDGTAQAASGGWFVLTARDDQGDIVLVKAFQVGADGIEADVPYRLLADGGVERAEVA